MISLGTVFSTVLAAFFALASAVTVAWGTVVRHRIALGASSAVMRTAMGEPLWWIGTLAAVVAYGLQLIALGFGALLVVQPILVLSLMFTLPLSAWYARRPMPLFEVLWSVALTAAVAVVVVYGRPDAGDSRPTWDSWWPALLAGILLLGALAAAAWRLPGARALSLGSAGGVIYGYVALLSKASVDILTHDGVRALLGQWPLYALVALAATGTVVQQYSFHAGPLAHSLPAMTIIEPIVAFGLGYVVLGEEFQIHSAAGWTVMAAALAVMVAATIVLSRVPPAGQARPRSRGLILRR